jgi:uncharacterized membrane protein YdbT with pleckstrin-like domain
MKTHHPNSRAERLRLREIKVEQKAKAKEKRLERLRRKALLEKETEDGLTDDYEGNQFG